MSEVFSKSSIVFLKIEFFLETRRARLLVLEIQTPNSIHSQLSRGHHTPHARGISEFPKKESETRRGGAGSLGRAHSTPTLFVPFDSFQNPPTTQTARVRIGQSRHRISQGLTPFRGTVTLFHPIESSFVQEGVTACVSGVLSVESVGVDSP
jgi:hypothetical protein